MQDLHNEVRRQIIISNDSYKSIADLLKLVQEFVVGNEVLLRVRPERFFFGMWKELHA